MGLMSIFVRFRPAAVKDLIHKVLLGYLSEKKYSSEDTPTWTKEIGDSIISQLKSAHAVWLVKNDACWYCACCELQAVGCVCM